MVDCGVYVEGQRLSGKYSYAAALSKVREIEPTGRGAFVWVGLHEPDESQMQDVADVFGLHPLAVEDAVQAHQRPKLDRYDETLVLILKTVNYVPHESVVLARQIVETSEVMIVVGKDFVVTVRHGEHGGLSDVRKQMDADPEHLRLGPYAVMHVISHNVVDHYLGVTSLIECDIDGIEEVAFTPGRKIDVEPIYLLKREVVELRRCVNPLGVAFQRIQTENKDLISKEVRRYLRDVADHHNEAADQIASYDDMLNSLVQAALARVGMQQNNDMRKMAAWAGILAVPTMFAAIYGMNFRFMPELNWTWGYPGLMAGLAVVCLILYFQFRNRNWLWRFSASRRKSAQFFGVSGAFASGGRMHSRGPVHITLVAGHLGRLPCHIFTAVDIESVLLAGGGLATTSQLLTVVSRKRLAGLVTSGKLIRVCHGVYAASEPDMSKGLAALELMANQPVVACMGTAAALYGFDTEGRSGLHVLDPGVRMRPSPGLMVHQRIGAPLRRVKGRMATAPAWTAIEVARVLRRPRALATLDAALHIGACTGIELDAAIREQRGRRKIVKVRELVDYADGRAESPMESEARLLFIDSGLPMPELQYSILDRHGRLWRVDFAWPDAMVLAEYDSVEWHVGRGALLHDRLKTARLQECGWTCIPMTVDDIRRDPIGLVARINSHLMKPRMAG